MDLGLDEPEDIDALHHCLDVITDIEKRTSTLPTDPAMLGQPNSFIARLVEELPDPPVDIRLTIASAVASSQSCLVQIKQFFDQPIPTHPVVLATLCRTALIASARLLLIVGPRDDEQKKNYAIRILLQESESLQRCYKKARYFVELKGLIPPSGLLDPQDKRHQHLNRITERISETEVLEKAAEIMADLLKASEFEDPTSGFLLKEHISWTFNVYSGVAHGFGWPRLVPGTQALPGLFTAELWITVGVCHMAIDQLQKAHQAS